MEKSTLEQLSKVLWYPFSDEPMIKSQWYMPRLCDPCFLFPEDSPDGKWHLFAHTWIGLEHFSSLNGIAWEPLKMIELRGHSPSIFYENGVWYLIYEKHDKLLQQFTHRPKEIQNLSTSRFEMRSSTDLVLFSEPKVVLDSKEVPFAGDGLKRARISRPQVFKVEDGYRIYYGASHIVLDGSRQKVSRYFATATASRLAGPYAKEKILLQGDADDPFCNMAIGAVKVIQLQDGFAAFACPYRWDRNEGRVRSSVVIGESEDGEHFQPIAHPVALPSPEEGWAGRFITSTDVHYKESEECWYCYYSANRKLWKERFALESVGLLLGKDPTPRPFPVTR